MHAQKLSSVGALASSITHEFNNVLTTIINYAKMGLRHKDVGTREKAFDKILAAGHRASKITTGMLSYARAQGERREATDLVTLVEDVLVLVEKDLQMHRVRLATNFVGRPLAIVNANQLQQVVLNLIVNARQAMDNGGNLYVAVRAHDESATAEISVRDTGCGIPAEKLREIFDPFYTTKQSDQQGQGWNGVGPVSLPRDHRSAQGPHPSRKHRRQGDDLHPQAGTGGGSGAHRRIRCGRRLARSSTDARGMGRGRGRERWPPIFVRGPSAGSGSLAALRRGRPCNPQIRARRRGAFQARPGDSRSRSCGVIFAKSIAGVAGEGFLRSVGARPLARTGR